MCTQLGAAQDSKWTLCILQDSVSSLRNTEISMFHTLRIGLALGPEQHTGLKMAYPGYTGYSIVELPKLIMLQWPRRLLEPTFTKKDENNDRLLWLSRHPVLVNIRRWTAKDRSGVLILIKIKSYSSFSNIRNFQSLKRGKTPLKEQIIIMCEYLYMCDGQEWKAATLCSYRSK